MFLFVLVEELFFAVVVKVRFAEAKHTNLGEELVKKAVLIKS